MSKLEQNISLSCTAGFPANFTLTSLNGKNGFTVNGLHSSDRLGISVSSGDINGDGINDLIMGADDALSDAGQVYVVFGRKSSFSSLVDISQLNGNNGFTVNGLHSGDYLGTAVSSGDINGDGINDLIMGAESALSRAGQVYVVFGTKSGFSSLVNLSQLNGNNGFTVNGLNSYDLLGSSVSSGDINGDGINDLIMGAYGVLSDAGQVYVVFGKKSGFSLQMDLSQLNGNNGFIVNGLNSNDELGISISSGDINGDGINDLIMGAGYALSKAGRVYVVFGTKSGFSSQLDLSQLNGNNGFTVNGLHSGDHLGYSVSSGDINGDGINDLIMGAYGRLSYEGQVYVVFGRKSGFSSQVDISQLNGNNGFTVNGLHPADYLGVSVSSGDINGSDIKDLIMSASGALSYAGQVYVVFGRKSGFSSQVDLSQLNGNNGFTVNGLHSGDHLGYSVSSGDINGDGINDLIMDAYDALSDAGQVYIIFGRSGYFSYSISNNLKSKNLLQLTGAVQDDKSASAVVVGDINNDGIDDIVIGSPNAIFNSGKITVVFGSNSLPTDISLGNLNVTGSRGSIGFEIVGASTKDYVGTSVALGDLNNDHYKDIIIGIPDALNSTGQVAIVFGKNSYPYYVDLYALDAQMGMSINGIANYGYLGHAVTSNDINGDHIDDLIIAANFANNGGEVYVVYGQQGNFPTVDLANLNSTYGFTIRGMDWGDNLGSSLTTGDINHDGIHDLIIGAYNALSSMGQSYVIFGGSNFGSEFNITRLNGGNGFIINGANKGDHTGHEVASADINGDGVDDVIVSANNALDKKGQTYVIFGHGGRLFPDSIDVDNLYKGSTGFVIDGENAGDISGSALAAGDITNDGIADIIIAAYAANNNTGTVYTYFGHKGSFGDTPVNLGDLIGKNGFKIEAPNLGEKLGYSLAIGDVNGDHINDIVIGAIDADNNAGKTYVIYGNHINDPCIGNLLPDTNDIDILD